MEEQDDVVPTGSKEEQIQSKFISADKINTEDDTEEFNKPEIPYIWVEPNQDDIEIIEEEDPLRLDGFVPDEAKAGHLIDVNIINNLVVEIIEGDTYGPFNKRNDKEPITSHQNFLEGNYRYDLPITKPATHSGGPPKNKKSDGKKWRDMKNRRLRELGQTYVGWARPSRKDGDTIVAKRGVERKERKLGPPCDSERCKSSAILQCNLVSESARNEIFNTFWHDMTWEQKKVYVVSLVINEYPKRRKIDEAFSRRSRTLLYNLRVPAGGETFRVCKKMFMSTLNIGEWSILNWVNRASAIPDCDSQTSKGKEKKTSVKVEEKE